MLPPFRTSAFALLALTAWTSCAAPPVETYVLAVHGGAGTIRRSEMTEEQEAAYRSKLVEALETGHAVLAGGGSSLDAVVATITLLEDSPLFNAGKGAVLTGAGTAELDASIMDGATGQAGAVAGVKHVKNPILAARAAMEQSEHVMLSGEGADAFASQVGLEAVPNSYFHTDRRREQLERAKEAEREQAGVPPEQRTGTVGAVALDVDGHLAAATSTGGMTNKRFGRIGDSPIVGAGTWADDDTCAVSGTGWGEYFIRGAVAHDVAALMEYGGLSVEDAARIVIIEKLTEAGGTGGVIAVDGEGNVAMPFNTEGMYRGYIGVDGEAHVAIYGDRRK